jgi:hypothetical protein
MTKNIASYGMRCKKAKVKGLGLSVAVVAARNLNLFRQDK